MEPENGLGDGEGNRKTVFVDTSLDTHLATIVSDSDTVSDLKGKIMLEHRECFPAIGDIKIHCLKVKRRGNYYHLSDSMLVKSAFKDSQKNWFLSVDASHLEQCDGIQHKPGDQLALPWVKEGRSIDTHDSQTQAEGPSKLSLIHGSSSKHPKIFVPFVNQKLPTSDGSCKKASKNIEEDRSSNLEPSLEQQLDPKVTEKLYTVVDKEIKSKKRIREVHNEEASVMKRRKTQRTEGDAKALEENRVLTNDADKVKNMGTSINDENSIEDKSKSKDAALDGVVNKAMNDEHTRTISVSQKKPKRTKKGKISALDQVAIVAPLSVEDVGEATHLQKNTEETEVIPDVPMVMENNIQQDMPFESKSKDADLDCVVNKAMNDEHTRTISVNQKKPKRGKKGQTSAHDQVAIVVPLSVEAVEEETHQKNTEASEVPPDVPMVEGQNSQQEMASQSKSKDAALDDVVTKAMNDENTKTTSVIQKKPKRTRKGKISAHDQVAIVAPLSVENVGEETHHQKNTEASEVIHDVAMAVEKNIQQETSQKEKCNELVEEADIGNEIPSSSMQGVTTEDELLVKHADDLVVDISSTVPTQVFDEKTIDEQNNDKTNIISEASEKTSMDDSLKVDDLIVKEVKIAEAKSRKEIKERNKKKNVGKSSKKDEVIERKETSIIDDDLHVDKDDEVSKTSQLNAEISEKQNENMDDDAQNIKRKRKKRNKKSGADVSQTDDDKLQSKAAQIEKSEIPQETSKNVTLSQAPKGNDVNSDVGKGSHEIDFMDYFSPDKTTPLDNVENRKDTKLSVKEKKPKRKSKEQQNGNANKVFIPEASTDGGVVKDRNAPTVTKVKTQQKDDRAIQSLSRNENNKALSSKKIPEASTNGGVGKDQNAPHVTKAKTQKTTTKIDAVKINKPQPQPFSESDSSSESESESFGRSLKSQKKITKQQPTTQVKNLKKNVPGVKSLLSTPGTIFGDNSDDSSADDNAIINSDSSTRTPSRNPSSPGESDSSIDSRRYVKRKEGGGNNNMNSQSRLKNISMSELLKSSSRYKKARFTAASQSQVNDTESEPVDFVPESQPVAKR
ncbi:unnamed protein product [Lactuca saligna]|uniref:Uncharacterized protein n=1 Tax=Lactuca saligna TaxID=75948 RepID=A0AA35ZW37_LACSI|nr:unnamed protein product [Lactuca saligna]